MKEGCKVRIFSGCFSLSARIVSLFTWQEHGLLVFGLGRISP